MFILQSVQGLMHFISNTVYYILAVSYHIGRGIIYAFSMLFACLREICAALVIIGEEFYRFLSELDSSLHTIFLYCRNTTNSGIGAALDVVAIFFMRLTNFLTNTKLHTKLLATESGRFVTNFVSLVQRSLLLIADSVWWLITILPKTLAQLLIEIGDVLVLSISEACRLLLLLVRCVIDDIFRYTIAVAIIFAVSQDRRRLLGLLRLSLRKVKLFYRMCQNGLVNQRVRWTTATSYRIHRAPAQQRQQEILSVSTHRIRREPLPRPSHLSPAAAEKLLEAQRCVVCQDQQKCVLLLPCKHLCLCEDCADHMVFSSRTQQHCPLCRGEIRQSMSVYT